MITNSVAAINGAGIMKIYYDPITVNCRKVLAGCELVGAQYDSEKMDYFGGDHKNPQYSAINPNESIPALVDGEIILWESNANLQYVADKNDASEAYPNDAATRADINRWHLWEASAWFPSCYTYLVENLVKPLTGSEPDPATLQAQEPNFHKLADIIEAALEKQDWLCGDSVTIADIAVAAPMHLHEHQKLPLEPHAGLRDWITRVEALPCWINTDPRPLLGLS